MCYQLPALLMPGVLVVVSPLLALMQDQVLALQAKAVAVAMLSSMQSMQEIAEIEQSLQNGQIKIVFVTPERLQNAYFLAFLKEIELCFFAIDEAHCVSEWGHEFRADYRQLGRLKQHFPNTPIAAFTATATAQVERDIVKQLAFSQPDNVVRGGVYRDNLFINAQPREGNGRGQLLDFLVHGQNEQGIIYTLSRKNTEDLADFLVGKGFNAQAYHAGLTTNQRTQIFKRFANDEIDIMVATIAFGMGIDKSNIRFIVHMSLPKTMEAYYQEIGRAGRDGLASTVLLLYASADLGLLGRFIADIEDETYRNLAYDKLNLIKKYAFSEACRHQMLSHYFDDTIPSCATNCDNCLEVDIDRRDISEQAKMFLSAVYRTGQNFGTRHIIDVLIGSENKKVLANRHQELSVYNIGTQTSKAHWKIIADRLLELDALMIGEFKVLKLTDTAKRILQSTQTVDIRSIHLKETPRRTTSSQNKPVQYEVDEIVLGKLKLLRTQIAKAHKMPAYIVFDDKTLREMAYFMPSDEAEFLRINGVGQIKYAKYGVQFLALLTQLRQPDWMAPELPPQPCRKLRQNRLN